MINITAGNKSKITVITLNKDHKKTSRTVNTVLISKYMIDGTLGVLEKLPSNDFVLGIGYKNEDAQIGITGSCAFTETFQECAIREIKEEAGLSCCLSDVRYAATVQKYKRTSKTFTIRASKCSPSLNCNTQKESDNKDRKACILIHGTHEELVNLLMKSPQTLDNKENIGYFVIIPISESIRIAKITAKTNSHYQWKYIG